jgi:hypothetical protein
VFEHSGCDDQRITKLEACLDSVGAFYNTNSNHKFYVADGTINSLTLASTGEATFINSVTADSLIISNSDSRIKNSDATGRIILGNSSTNTFVIFYGTSHPTQANQTVFSNGGITTCTFSATNSATFAGTISAGIITGDSNSTGVPSIVAKVGSGGNNGTFGFGNNSNYRIRGGSDFGAMIFDTNGAEYMRLTSNGDLCIKRNSGGGELNLQGTIFLYSTTAGAGNSTLKYNTGTGAVTYDTSARAYKKDIQDLNYGLAEILQMSPKKYKYISDDANDIGFIADEMYEIVPEIVALANNEIMNSDFEEGEPVSINYDRFAPIFVNAIKELEARIKQLESK